MTDWPITKIDSPRRLDPSRRYWYIVDRDWQHARATFANRFPNVCPPAVYQVGERNFFFELREGV